MRAKQTLATNCFFLLLAILTTKTYGQELAAPVVDNNIHLSTTTNSNTTTTKSFSTINCNRQAIIDDYVTNYLGSSFNVAEMAWTGDVATCDPGSISDSVHDKILQRINYFRRLVGVSDNIYLDDIKNGKCQESALMQEANGGLSHCSGPNNAPCDTWDCNTPNAIQAAQSSNIATNSWNYANPIDMYIRDAGSSNAAVGHRRWILFSRGKEMGNGITPSKQILWVLWNYAPQPTYNNFIAYPSPGYFPRSLIYARWSFGIPGADFSNATVTVKRDGQVVLSPIISSTTSFADPTLVWIVGSTFTSDEDVEFEVTISGISDAPQSSYTYKVFAIKEETPSISFDKIDSYCDNNGEAIATLSAGATSYDWIPGTDTTQMINNLAPGTYTLTAEDLNSCTFIDSVTILNDTISTPRPGDGTPDTIQYISGTGNLNLSTTGTVLKTDEATGWWITKTNPISDSISDQALLDSAIVYASIQPFNDGTAINNNPSVLFLDDSITNGMTYDCSNMDNTATYFATPFVTSYRPTIPDANCIATNGSVGNIFVSGQPAKFTSISPDSVSCRPDSLLGLPEYSLDITITGYTGPPGDLGIWIVDNNYTGTTILYYPYQSGNGTFTFSKSDFYNYFPNDPGDPNWTTGMTVLAWQLTGNGMQNGSIDLSLDITYPGDPGIPFPTMTYSSCIFGDPIPFTCYACTAPSNIPTIPGTYQATDECTDASGWTHYWDNVDGFSGNNNDLLLLSVKKNGTDIGSVDDGTFDLFIEVGDNNSGAAIHIPSTVPYVTNPEGWYVMDRYWLLTPTSQPQTPVSVRNYYTTDDFNAIDDAPDVDPIGHESLTFYKTSGNANPAPGTGHTGITSAQISFYNTEGIDWLYTGDAVNNYHTAELFTVSSFSGGGGGASNCEGCGPLPVELISFSGHLKDDAINLEWRTAGELDNDYFELEKSVDGIHFESMSFIPSKGNSNHMQQYAITDEQPKIGNNYYRLSQIDYDGTTSYSGNIVVVEYRNDELIYIYPNPASKEIHVHFGVATNNFSKYELYDSNGRLIHQGQTKLESNEVLKLDVNHLNKGLYLLHLINGSRNEVVSFLKK